MTDKQLYPGEGDVDDAVLGAFVDAITKAYPDKNFLAMRLRTKWGVRVEDEISALDVPGKVLVDRIASYAQAQGGALDLLGLAWSDKPGNFRLAALADQWLPDKAGVLARYGKAPPAAPAFNIAQAAGGEPARPPLESLVVRRSRLFNLAAFIAGLKQLSGALCRVGIPQVNGTGFLIGRRTVLTNYHVLQSAIELPAEGASIRCEFDFTAQGAAVKTYSGAPGPAWLGPKSRYAPSDLTGTGTPGENELDFAIIHLDQDVELGRPSLVLPQVQPLVVQGDYLLIGQHPEGGEEQVAPGQVVAWPGEGLRCRYDVTTKPGSSGSPVLNFDLQLVALHHAADPTSNPTYNQGVPINRILSALAVQGLDLSAL
ncbi:MAG: trypsin-like peptidase domain-containing protein [Sphingomonas bacterium]